jgi:hypothetical protein
VISNSEDFLQDNLRRQIKAEIALKSQTVKQVFNNSEELLMSLVMLEQQLLKSTIFKSKNLPQDMELESGELFYESAVVMRQENFDSKGEKDEKSLSFLSEAFRSFYYEPFFYYQTGFTGQDNLAYPGFYFGERDYDYQLRQWFYNASDSKFLITQPHFDEFFQDVKTFSFSRKVKSSGQVAMQLKLKLDSLFQEVFRTYSLKHEQHYMVVSNDGFILAISDDWAGRKDKIMKVFNETIGISSKKWEKIKDSDDFEELFKFTRPKNPYKVKNSDEGTEYRLMKIDIKVNPLTFYLIVCYRFEDLSDQIDDIRENFNETFNTIFYIILIIGIIIVIVILIVVRLAIRDLVIKFFAFEAVLDKIFSRALFKDSTQMMDLSQLLVKPGMFSDLISAFEARMRQLRQKEEKNSDFFMKKIKPPETYLYLDWKNKVYPKGNSIKSKVDWVDSLRALKKNKDYF